MNINAIKEQKAARVAEARNLLNSAETEKRSLTAGEKTAFDTLKSEITNLESDEQRATFLADAERRQAGQPVDKSMTALESRISLVDAINAQVEQRQLTGALAEYAQEHFRTTGKKAQGVAVPMSLFNEQRAAQTTTTAAGIVPDDFRADQFVGILRNALVVKSLGARVLPNLRGDVVIPRQKTSATAQWLAEGDALTDTGMTFDSITMAPRHVGAITELSRQLLQQSNPAIEQLVRDDFIQVVSAAVDKALVHGDGVKQPKGLLLATGTTTATLATLTWETIQAVIEKLALLNITPNAWLTHPAVATILKTTLRETGLPGYLLDGGNVAGIPLTATNQLDQKTGTPATGRIILGDFKEMVIGTWGSVDVLANQFAEGPYSRGAVQIRILTTMDMVARRPEAFAIANDVAL